jgi:ubiquinol-cytochrome c reductase cytochrome c subunit
VRRRALRVSAVLALLALAAAAAVSAAPEKQGGAGGTRAAGARSGGAAIYADDCASCHGPRGEGGIEHRGPALVGVGAAAVDFYLSTGRMPLARPGIEPERADSPYTRSQRADLTRYVVGLGPGGPAVPEVDASRGNMADGRRLFTDSCSGCHQIQAKGGIAPGGLVAPPLDRSSATQIGEAIRVGPYLMPRFGSKQLSSEDVDSIARYVTATTTDPGNNGGWSLGNVGPITEGLVAFLLIGGVLVVTARIIGERTG